MLDYILKESDDYELMITCDPEHVVGIRNTVSSINHVPVSQIGTITANKGEIEILGSNGDSRRVAFSGWDHFAK